MDGAIHRAAGPQVCFSRSRIAVYCQNSNSWSLPRLVPALVKSPTNSWSGDTKIYHISAPGGYSMNLRCHFVLMMAAQFQYGLREHILCFNSEPAPPDVPVSLLLWRSSWKHAGTSGKWQGAFGECPRLFPHQCSLSGFGIMYHLCHVGLLRLLRL